MFHVPKKNQIYPFAFPLTPQHNNIFHIQFQAGKRLNFNKKLKKTITTTNFEEEINSRKNYVEKEIEMQKTFITNNSNVESTYLQYVHVYGKAININMEANIKNALSN